MEIVTKIAPIALALIMLGLGLGLSGRDFLRVIKQPRDFVIGFICQVIYFWFWNHGFRLVVLDFWFYISGFICML